MYVKVFDMTAYTRGDPVLSFSQVTPSDFHPAQFNVE